MSDARLLRVVGDFSAAATADAETIGMSLCDASVGVLGVTGAAVTLVSAQGLQEAIGATGGAMVALEQLEQTVGEGPCVDAYVLGVPVLEPDLAAPEVRRWVGFSGPAVAMGAPAVFGFPLAFGSVRLGALNLYADRAGKLTHDQYEDALIVAQVVTHTVLGLQAGAPVGSLADELLDSSSHLLQVHQATGMVSARLDITVGAALARLRAHAYASGRPLSAVAADVVGRRLRLEL